MIQKFVPPCCLSDKYLALISTRKFEQISPPSIFSKVVMVVWQILSLAGITSPCFELCWCWLTFTWTGSCWTVCTRAFDPAGEDLFSASTHMDILSMIDGNVLGHRLHWKEAEICRVYICSRTYRSRPAAFSPHILIVGVSDDEIANSLGHATCKIIRSVIDIASSCLFPTDNHKIYWPDKNAIEPTSSWHDLQVYLYSLQKEERILFVFQLVLHSILLVSS